MSVHGFTPQWISVLREGYTLRQGFRDLLAGAITGVVALPLAIAFAIASGVSPMQGVYTAIIGGFLISFLSGSRVQIGGPTGAFIVIVAGIVRLHGFEGLVLATLLAGLILLVMGLLKFGSVIRLIPWPVTLGFTSGIAIVIATSQLQELLGLPGAEGETGAAAAVVHAIRHAKDANPSSLFLGLLTVVLIQTWPRVTKRIPGSIVAVVACTALAYVLGWEVETIGSRFGVLTVTVPSLSLPVVSWETIQPLIPAAISIAMLGAIESLLSAVVADGMTSMRHRPNMELVGQGIANLVTPLFGGIPCTGAIARTAVNIRNGGRTPFSGMIHAGVLVLLLSLLGAYVRYIPMTVLAGILLCVAYAMGEFHHAIRMAKAPKSDFAVMLVTLVLTVFLDLTVAIPAGMILALFLFMTRMESVTHIGLLDESEEDPASDAFSLSRYDVPEGVQVYEIQGPFFFGAAHKMQNAIPGDHPPVLILRMRHVPAMDATGLFALERMIREAGANRTIVILSGIHEQPRSVIERANVPGANPNLRMVADIAEALHMAREYLEGEPGKSSP